MAKFFITGSKGFIGRNLVEYYSKLDHTIVEYSRGEKLQEKLVSARPDIIINSAAEIYNADTMFESNVILTKDCLDYVKDNPHTKLLHFGSSAEYGPVSIPSSESMKINPVDMYQATKGAATVLCQGYARQYNLQVLIVRPYSVYGRYEKPHRLFPKLYSAFINNQSMKLYDGYHDFIYINDFIRGCDLLLQQNIEPGEIVNLGSGIQHSNFAILEIFQSILKKTAPVEKIEELAKSFESKVWICDTTYAKTKYNFSCEYDIYAGIQNFLKTANY